MTLKQRKENFTQFYEELIPSLADFVEKMGIFPGHVVLKQAVDCAPFLSRALEHMEISSQEDRLFLLSRVGYFVGEYFAQKYGGAWYVNEIEGSRYYARYVVGKFWQAVNPNVMVDPFLIAEDYVQQSVPRNLQALLVETETELKPYFRLS
jgi:hypothetical protein